MNVASAGSGPLDTLARGLTRAHLAAGDAAQRIVDDPTDLSAHVDLLVAGRSQEAMAGAFASTIASVDETLGRLLDRRA